MLRRRLRTITLWTGTALCVLIAAAFVVSGWWLLAIQIPTSYGPAIAVSGGASGLIFDQQWTIVFVAESRLLSPGVNAAPGPTWSWWTIWAVDRRYLTVPLYAVFLAVALPTLLAWRFWPKLVKPGHCRCGYDLRGNVSGTCPECGRDAAVIQRPG